MIGKVVYLRNIPKHRLDMMENLVEMSENGKLISVDNNTVKVKTSIDVINYVFDEHFKMLDYIKKMKSEVRELQLEFVTLQKKKDKATDILKDFVEARKKYLDAYRNFYDHFKEDTDTEEGFF